MAKARVSTNPIYEGGAGGYSFYSRGGEQIMRQRRNNSNYGESASRSMAQQLRRVKWANLVNLYKVMSPWQPKAYESKVKGQTDYNLFMSVNANSTVVALPKDMASAGCAVVSRVQVSRGSLPQIGRSDVAIEQVFDTDIRLSAAISSATTIAELSSDIISNNSAFVDGDNIGIAVFTNYRDVRGYPYAGCYYFELTLDTSNSALLTSLPYGSRIVSGQVGMVGGLVLGVSWTIGSGDVGAAFIHTRRYVGGLKVSNAWIQVNGDAFWTEFTGQSWYEQCAATYGVDLEVPLDPSFPEGFIDRVTANGAVINRGASLSGAQVIRVYGNGVSSPSFRFVGNGIDFVPLYSGDGWVEFVITVNGSYEIYVASNLYLAFQVVGIVTPSELQGRVYGYYRDGDGLLIADTLETSASFFLNYSLPMPAQAASICARVYYVGDDSLSEGDFEIEGGSLDNYQVVAAEQYVELRIIPASSSTQIVVRYKDVIIFVGNLAG